jgi:hypothetical protein
MSLAGDDGKGKSALCGGRRKLMAVEQIVLPSLLLPSWGGRRRPEDKREPCRAAQCPTAKT